MSSMFIPRFKMDLHIAVVIAFTVAIAEFATPEHTLAQIPAYTVLELPLAGQVPIRLNNQGDLVGRSDNGAGQMQAMTWKHGNLQAKRLGFLVGGEYSSASAINDLGEVAGSSNTGNALVPFLWKPTGGLQRVTLLKGDTCGQAFGINKKKHIVGSSSGALGTRAFLWMPNGGARPLGSLLGGSYGMARDINDSDEIVGTSGSPSGNRAVLWTVSGNVRDLGTLPGDTSSEAFAINKAGDVVGYSKGAGGLRAFLWTKGGGMEELGILPGGNSSRALDINDLGYVVGSSSSSSGDHAFIWTRQTGMMDLNSAAASAGLGVVFVEAKTINHAGQILVMGETAHQAHVSTDPSEDYLCAPAPPSTFLLTPAPVK